MSHDILVFKHILSFAHSSMFGLKVTFPSEFQLKELMKRMEYYLHVLIFAQKFIGLHFYHPSCSHRIIAKKMLVIGFISRTASGSNGFNGNITFHVYYPLSTLLSLPKFAKMNLLSGL